MLSSSGTVSSSLLRKGVYKPESFTPPRGIAPSSFRPLRKIPHCCLPKESGPYLSPSVADRSLKPTTDRGLGKPLPHQLANQARAHSQAKRCIQNDFMIFYSGSINFISPLGI